MKGVSVLNFVLIVFVLFSVNSFSQNPEWVNLIRAVNVTAIAEEGNYIWVGTNGGLVRIDKTTGSTTFYNKANSGLPDNYILAIAIDGQGNKWIGTYYRGVARFDGTNWVVYNESNSGLPNNEVTSIAIDGQGNKWIGTNGGGVARFDGTNWTVYNSSNSGLRSNSVEAIAIDGQG
ncbi:MAG: two-component regulator propeller domain-containing protein, partial [Candidatus Kryptonium sp.]